MEKNVEDMLRNLDKMTLDAARNAAKGMISKNTKATKLFNLHRDLDRARSAREVSRIMYNVYLAGTGMAITNSGWQNLHRMA